MKAKNAAKAVLLVTLALASSQASAEWEWELVAKTVSGNKFFMDISTKRQQGRYTLVWTGAEYAEAQKYEGKDAYSAKTLDVYDCAEFRFGHKSGVFYSEKATEGKIVYSYSVEMHEVVLADVVPDSVAETKFNKACGKG
jgi:hypothetical protein